MDLLSQSLGRIRLRGSGVEAHPPQTRAVFTDRTVHIAMHTTVRINLAERQHVDLRPGEALVLPRGGRHEVLSHPEHDRAGGRPTIAWLTGRYALYQAQPSALLGALPDSIALLREHGTEWLDTSARQLLTEWRSPSPGSELMVSRILDLLFIHALRHDAQRNHRPGTLIAALDPSLAPVITAVHDRPDHAWTLRELARVAGMSRSVLTERFTKALNAAPMAYVTRLRLDLAAEQLTTTDRAVSSIARSSGYASDAAFARAFRRRYDLSSSRWRAEQGTVPGAWP